MRQIYAFDPNPKARSTIKERFVWMLYMGIVFFLLYGSANQFTGISAPHPSFVMDWERNIPFIEPFIIPYMSSDVMFVIAFFLPYTRHELRVLSVRVFTIILISVICFVLFPLEFSFKKPEVEGYTFLFDLLGADLPYNQLPSLHISFAVVLWASMKQYVRSPLLKALVALWFILIALSTLLVYQHHFIDLPTGLLVGLIAIYWIPQDKAHPLTMGFTTPRSLKMGLYYLLGAVGMMLCAFFLQGFTSWLCVWLFFTLFSVSLIYILGLNTLLEEKKGLFGIVQWLLLAPYFAGNYLSWCYYRRRLPLMAKVDDGVYLGRQPTQGEYTQIQSLGISHILHLSPEQRWHDTSIPQTKLPFLDQTIPSPQALHHAVLLIESMKSDGLYIHCALGLSRSVLVIAAWRIYQGDTLEELEEQFAIIRPEYVKRPYMRIALELYMHQLHSFTKEES